MVIFRYHFGDYLSTMERISIVSNKMLPESVKKCFLISLCAEVNRLPKNSFFSVSVLFISFLCRLHNSWLSYRICSVHFPDNAIGNALVMFFVNLILRLLLFFSMFAFNPGMATKVTSLFSSQCNFDLTSFVNASYAIQSLWKFLFKEMVHHLGTWRLEAEIFAEISVLFFFIPVVWLSLHFFCLPLRLLCILSASASQKLIGSYL